MAAGGRLHRLPRANALPAPRAVAADQGTFAASITIPDPAHVSGIETGGETVTGYETGPGLEFVTAQGQSEETNPATRGTDLGTGGTVLGPAHATLASESATDPGKDLTEIDVGTTRDHYPEGGRGQGRGRGLGLAQKRNAQATSPARRIKIGDAINLDPRIGNGTVIGIAIGAELALLVARVRGTRTATANANMNVNDRNLARALTAWPVERNCLRNRSKTTPEIKRTIDLVKLPSRQTKQQRIRCHLHRHLAPLQALNLDKFTRTREMAEMKHLSP
ncbi:hypothetical protein FN846DRAFT_981260 [Sphaerosporella brunnea]|uniref:Uncharacterized protein n=1 Tax=Sphaerosporella brunnea TaxID=1250544 RepID=A0A5J5ECV2_9PEZI|nr:hypothetical protein FN846DRAFT_981260 [Sphaerosporella brunnea]